MKTPNQGNLIIITAPSGTGKTTLLKKTFASLPEIAFSVSHTTRLARKGEKNGTDYFFIDHETFLAMREQNEFLEWAEVHGNFYGTSRQKVHEQLARGIDIVLDIDVQGASQITASEKNTISIFIVPPSWEELEKRLTNRASDTPETIALRLANARREILELDKFDHVIVNDSLDTAADMLRFIIIAERSRDRRSADGKPLDLMKLKNNG
ncbi:MAG: guanylate kinase [Proteobacteria bacterium]|nr:guanylate kinase [Pseudomonadota bacterium]MBU1710395.1 guanylate kinase [Pseudomonadota bacterium]